MKSLATYKESTSGWVYWNCWWRC